MFGSRLRPAPTAHTPPRPPMRLGAGMPREGRREYCEAVAAALHLLPLLRLPVYQLAADQRKYLGVAVELVGNPSILFLDEPTTGVGRARRALWGGWGMRAWQVFDKT